MNRSIWKAEKRPKKNLSKMRRSGVNAVQMGYNLYHPDRIFFYVAYLSNPIRYYKWFMSSQLLVLF